MEVIIERRCAIDVHKKTCFASDGNGLVVPTPKKMPRALIFSVKITRI